jgi:nicotinate-nucleotide adenylyltransferase
MNTTIENSSFHEKIGVMGGTFDPIHYGHLFAAAEARSAIGLDRVIFVPSGSPPHKNYGSMASPEDRYAMTKLAISGNPKFEISSIETGREGSSYTVDTLREFALIYPGSEFFLITGLDAALDITNWHRYPDILSLCSVVVIARSGYIRDKIKELDAVIKESLIILDTKTIDISATDIRNRLRAGARIRYMTPDAVCQYIEKKKLYSGTEA